MSVRYEVTRGSDHSGRDWLNILLGRWPYSVDAYPDSPAERSWAYTKYVGSAATMRGARRLIEHDKKAGVVWGEQEDAPSPPDMRAVPPGLV